MSHSLALAARRNMPRHLCYVCGLALPVLIAGCGTDPEDAIDGGEPSDATPPHADRRQDDGALDRVDSGCQPVLETLREAGEMYGAPGSGLALVVDGTLICTETLGVEHDSVALTEESLFRWGARTSKLVTALAVLELAASGDVDLDVPVQDVLGVDLEPAEWAAQLRLRHLLWQVSGLPADSGRLDPCTFEGGPTASEYLASFTVGDRVMWAPPGRLGYDVLVADVLLGAAVEAVTGRPLRELVQERVYEPLGMTGSYYGWSAALESRGVFGYQSSGAGVATRVDQPLQGCAAVEPRFGVTTSLRDGGRLIEVLARGGLDADGSRLLAASTLTALFDGGPGSWWGPWYRMTAGGLLIDGPTPLYYLAGRWAGGASGLGVSPESGFGVIVLSNLDKWEMHRLPLSAALLSRGYQAPQPDEAPPEPWSPTATELSAYAGRYVAPVTGIEATLEATAEGNLLATTGVGSFTFRPTGLDVFREQASYRSGRLTFWRAGGVIDVVVMGGYPYAFYPEGAVPSEIAALAAP